MKKKKKLVDGIGNRVLIEQSQMKVKDISKDKYQSTYAISNTGQNNSKKVLALSTSAAMQIR